MHGLCVLDSNSPGNDFKAIDREPQSRQIENMDVSQRNHLQVLEAQDILPLTCLEETTLLFDEIR